MGIQCRTGNRVHVRPDRSSLCNDGQCEFSCLQRHGGDFDASSSDVELESSAVKLLGKASFILALLFFPEYRASFLL